MDKDELLKNYKTLKYTKLAASLLLDAAGMASYLIPGLGESGDLVWGPISGVATFLMFRGTIGLAGGGANAIEEVLPVTDIIPGVTLTWFVKYVILRKQTLTQYIDEKREEEDIVDSYVKNSQA